MVASGAPRRSSTEATMAGVGHRGARRFMTKSHEDKGADLQKQNGWWAFFQNVSTSHPSHWMMIQRLTFRVCMVARRSPFAHNTLPLIYVFL
jgi:hypothetical protein